MTDQEEWPWAGATDEDRRRVEEMERRIYLRGWADGVKSAARVVRGIYTEEWLGPSPTARETIQFLQNYSVFMMVVGPTPDAFDWKDLLAPTFTPLAALRRSAPPQASNQTTAPRTTASCPCG